MPYIGPGNGTNVQSARESLTRTGVRKPWRLVLGFTEPGLAISFHAKTCVLSLEGAQGDVWLLAAIAILGEHRLRFGFEWLKAVVKDVSTR